MKETVLLTGYAGFIGSQLLRDLLKENYTVIGIDNFSEGSNKKNFEGYEHKAKLLKADISDPQISDILKKNDISKIDYIINCAAQSHVDRSFDQVNTFIDSNIKGPLNLAKIALDKSWGVKKMVQVSTDEVFAESPQPFHEGSLHTPQNAYSSSKSSAETFLRNYYKAFNLPLIITNGANTYGPRQLSEKIIPLTIKHLLIGKKVPLYKTPAQRMWLHVEDHSRGIIHALQYGEIGENYCLAPNLKNELFTSELINTICDILNLSFKDNVDLVPDRPNYDLRYYMLNDKAFHKLGWIPLKDISLELPSLIEYYKKEFIND